MENSSLISFTGTDLHTTPETPNYTDHLRLLCIKLADETLPVFLSTLFYTVTP